jgi:response regulator RpfG family c-di-GMP phosphodiesterase
MLPLPLNRSAAVLADARGHTVMVIEDHKDSREMLGAVLRSLQAHVVEARNVEEAELEFQFRAAAVSLAHR